MQYLKEKKEKSVGLARRQKPKASLLVRDTILSGFLASAELYFFRQLFSSKARGRCCYGVPQGFICSMLASWRDSPSLPM